MKAAKKLLLSQQKFYNFRVKPKALCKGQKPKFELKTINSNFHFPIQII